MRDLAVISARRSAQCCMWLAACCCGLAQVQVEGGQGMGEYVGNYCWQGGRQEGARPAGPVCRALGGQQPALARSSQYGWQQEQGQGMGE